MDSVTARHTQPEPAQELSERDQAVLDFERQWWKYAGAKEQAIRDQFQMSATRYYQVLNALIDRPEALAHDPLLVKRLRRLRAARQRQQEPGQQQEAADGQADAGRAVEDGDQHVRAPAPDGEVGRQRPCSVTRHETSDCSGKGLG